MYDDENPLDTARAVDDAIPDIEEQKIVEIAQEWQNIRMRKFGLPNTHQLTIEAEQRADKVLASFIRRAERSSQDVTSTTTIEGSANYPQSETRRRGFVAEGPPGPVSQDEDSKVEPRLLERYENRDHILPTHVEAGKKIMEVLQDGL